MAHKGGWLGGVVPAVATVLTACALPATHFSGSEADRAVQPSAVPVYRTTLEDFDSLGRVTAVCERKATPAEEFSGEVLSQLDCSKPLLVQALRERAAEVGGTALAEILCVDVPPEFGPDTDLCTAKVMRAPGSHREAELTEAEPAHEAWEVTLSFVPSAGFRRGEVTAKENVDRLERLRQNEVQMGTLSATCDGCARDVVLDGLRTTAGKLGMRAVVNSQCSADEESWTCTAIVAGYEKDPDRIAAAR